MAVPYWGGAAFRVLRASRAVPRRRHHARLASASGDAGDRLGLFRRRANALPARHLRQLRARLEMSASPSGRTAGEAAPRRVDSLAQVQQFRAADRGLYLRTQSCFYAIAILIETLEG